MFGAAHDRVDVSVDIVCQGVATKVAVRAVKTRRYQILGFVYS